MKLFLMKSTEKSYFFAGLSVLLWSTVATSFKLGLSELDYIQLIFFASATSVVVLFFILLIQGKVKLLLAQSPKQIGYSVMLGILNPLIYYLVLFKAYSLLPAQLAQPLNMVWPIVLTILSVPLLGQKIGKWSFAGLFISFAGVVVISSQGGLSGFKNRFSVLIDWIWSYFTYEKSFQLIINPLIKFHCKICDKKKN